MLRILFLLISCVCVLAQGTINEDEEMDVFRLPNTTEPTFYKLKIWPIVEPEDNNFVFTGDVSINILVKSTTNELILNAVELSIIKIQIQNIHNVSENFNIISNKFVKKNEQLKITVDPELIADQEYEVKIEYSGKLRNDMIGFYKSSYKNENNDTKWLTVTQFEPTYARLAFPCYDEPKFKTPFKIFVIRKDTEISLSNMPRDGKSYQVQDTENYICDPYQTTEPIATYLVAFSVSEFMSTTADQKIHVYTHKEYIDQVVFIEEKANKILNMMEIYTNIPYPYPKVDLLAVPDFSAGAMENWGLNTYREIYLLVNEKSREKDIETVTTVVQHELAHQWFGDLVTCSWWSYLWLNEAFATLFEYFAVEVAEPNWRIGDMFIIEQHQEALAYDHRPKHPLTASVNTIDEINDIFDTITYSKGASILRMLRLTLGDDIFRSSLSLYLNTNKYKSVEPKHLWNAFDSVIDEANYESGLLGNTLKVEEFMNSWTNQAGYPMIYVENSNNSNGLVIAQKRFQVDVPRVYDNTLWYVGLSYTTEKNKQFHNLQPSVWLKNTEAKVTIPRTENSGWVIFNLQSSGFYRVNYDSKNWDLLITQMINEPKAIHVLNRAQLIDDAFNLARAGELSYSVPLTLVSYLEKEDDFLPFYSVMNSMSYLVEQFRRCPHTGSQIKELTKKYAEIAYRKVSYLYKKNDDKHLTKTSMDAISNWACKLEVESCVELASNYFDAWQQNETIIPPDVKNAALCIGIKNGTEDTWNTVFNLYLETSSASEKESALLALACCTNSTILSNYLNLLLDVDCPIRPQDFRTVINTLVSTPVGINVTTDFLQNKIKESLDKMWKGEDMIMKMFDTLASSVATTKEINELNAIRNLDYLSPTLKKSFDESYKTVELNSNYFERSHPLLHKWFSPPEDQKTQSSAISNVFLSFNITALLLFSIIILLANNEHAVY